MKRILVIGIMVVVLLCLVAAPVFASANSLTNNWKVYNGKPATSSFWDINPLKVSSGGYQIPVQQFVSETSGSFVIYFLNNYNVSLTGNQTINANVSWTSGTYKTRSTVFPGAYVRLEFQDTTAGTYDSNDYWWYTVGLDLNTLSSPGTLSASLSDRAHWINQSGKPATDLETNWLEWQGDTVAMSPYEGFTKAMKDVKQLGLSFGSSGSYASGVALDGETGTFTVSSFTIAP